MSADDLTKHEQTSHFNCDQCDFKAVRKTLLTAHISSNHKVKTKAATKIFDMCKFSSTNVKGLNKHKADEHTKKSICLICDKPKV